MLTPCSAWAEHLALRREDLSPAALKALDAHLATCPNCRSVLADYNKFDAALQALPTSSVKPLPRLIPAITDLERAPVARINKGKSQQFPGKPLPVHSRTRRIFGQVSRKLPFIAIASIVLCAFLLSSLWQKLATNTHTAGTVLHTFAQNDFVGAVAWSPDGRYIASGNWDHSVRVWNAITGGLITVYANKGQAGDPAQQIGHTELVDAVAWSPAGQLIASASWDHTVQVWDAMSGQHITTYTGHSDFVSALAWSPDGRTIASASWDHTVQVWDVYTGEHLRSYNQDNTFVGAGSGLVLTVSWSPDGRYLASSGDGTKVNIWDAHSNSQVPLTQFFYDVGYPVNVLAWSPKGHDLAVGGQDNLVRIWDVQAGAQLLTIYKGHKAEVNALAWSPDGKMVASASDDYTVQVWDIKSGATLLTYQGHTEDVVALSWSPDGKRIASGSWDRTVQVWEAPEDT